MRAYVHESDDEGSTRVPRNVNGKPWCGYVDAPLKSDPPPNTGSVEDTQMLPTANENLLEEYRLKVIALQEEVDALRAALNGPVKNKDARKLLMTLMAKVAHLRLLVFKEFHVNTPDRVDADGSRPTYSRLDAAWVTSASSLLRRPQAPTAHGVGSPTHTEAYSFGHLRDARTI
eukprot:GHVU01007733.1.p1 GENE.GHVU01007733.1~~GHVU01007733.1.p1  ORF type:complete len:174 (-),score=20.53 GHVU01007733.1:236-757(-)